MRLQYKQRKQVNLNGFLVKLAWIPSSPLSQQSPRGRCSVLDRGEVLPNRVNAIFFPENMLQLVELFLNSLQNSLAIFLLLLRMAYRILYNFTLPNYLRLKLSLTIYCLTYSHRVTQSNFKARQK